MVSVNNGLTNTSPTGQRVREWGSLIAAAAIGPTFLLLGYHVPGLVFRTAAGADIFLCALIVPALVFVAGRRKFVAWQLAIISITLAVLGDNIRLNAIHHGEILEMAFVFWATGTLLSSPVPMYFLLKPLTPRWRILVSIMIGLIALSLWLGLKRITL